MAANQQQPAEAPSESAPIQWTLPAGWKQTAGASQMRFATIEVSSDPKAELTVVPLGPDAAAPLPNVVRWAGQLKLPAPNEADLPKFVTPTQISGEQAQLVDMTGSSDTGTPPMHLLAAIIPHAGQVWFFTLKAPEPIVAVQKANFDTFIHSIQFPTEPATSGAASPLQSADAQISPAAGGSYRLTSWQTPEGWQEQPGSNQMRVTSFRVGSGEQHAEVIISRIPQGRSGTLVDNYNRWRGQVGLGPIADQSEAHSQSGSVGGLPAMFVTFVGPEATGGASKEVIVAMTIVGADDWFIKMVGPQPIVSAEQNAFRQFANSLKFIPESK